MHLHELLLCSYSLSFHIFFLIVSFCNINTNIFIAGPASSLLYGMDYIAPQLAQGYITSKLYNDPSWPDLHIYIHEQLLNPNTINQLDTVFFAVELVRSDSEGSIKLASSDPNDLPIIDPNMLSDPTD